MNIRYNRPGHLCYPHCTKTDDKKCWDFLGSNYKTKCVCTYILNPFTPIPFFWLKHIHLSALLIFPLLIKGITSNPGQISSFTIIHIFNNLTYWDIILKLYTLTSSTVLLICVTMKAVCLIPKITKNSSEMGLSCYYRTYLLGS